MAFLQSFVSDTIPPNGGTGLDKLHRVECRASDIVGCFQRFRSIDEMNPNTRIYKSIVSYANRTLETYDELQEMLSEFVEYSKLHRRLNLLMHTGFETALANHCTNPIEGVGGLLTLPEEMLNIIMGICSESIRDENRAIVQRIENWNDTLREKNSLSEELTRAGFVDNPISIRDKLVELRSTIRATRYSTHRISEGLIHAADVSALLQTCTATNGIFTLQQRKRRLRFFSNEDIPKLGVAYSDFKGVRVRRDLFETPGGSYWPDRPGAPSTTTHAARMPSVSCTRPFHLYVGVVDFETDATNVVLRQSSSNNLQQCSQIAPPTHNRFEVQMRASLCHADTGIEVRSDVASLRVDQMHIQHFENVYVGLFSESVDYTNVDGGFSLHNGFHRLKIQVCPGLNYSSSSRIGRVVVKVSPMKDSIYTNSRTLTATSPIFVLTRKWVVPHSTVDTQRRKRRLEWAAGICKRVQLPKRALLNHGNQTLATGRTHTADSISSKVRWGAMPVGRVLQDMIVGGV
jgi:hypothetical protein